MSFMLMCVDLCVIESEYLVKSFHPKKWEGVNCHQSCLKLVYSISVICLIFINKRVAISRKCYALYNLLTFKHTIPYSTQLDSKKKKEHDMQPNI